MSDVKPPALSKEEQEKKEQQKQIESALASFLKDHPEIKEAEGHIMPTTGKVAVIIKRKGRHTIAAQRIMGKDPDNYYPALMHQLVYIDGKQLPMEDFPEMDGEDYDTIFLAIQGN